MRRSENGRRRQTTWLRVAASILVCGVPLVLLIDIRNTFYFDWFNHLWMIEYYGEYIKHRGSMPHVFMATSLVGIPLPIFYADKFYAVTGVISSFVGSAAAFRITALVALLIQFWHVRRAVWCATQKESLSFIVATIVSWAIYPLTNLYNRSALTEFIAVAFLTAAGASLFVLVFRLSNGRKSYYDAAGFGLLYAVAALAHPLTALFGCILLLLIGAVAFLTLRRWWLICVAIFSVLMTAAVLSPWFYVIYRFGHSLSLTDPAVIRDWFRNIGFMPDSLDNLWSRLSPVPVDLRSIIKGTDVSTPYLDAQIMSPLILLAAGQAWTWLISNRALQRKSSPLLVGILSLSLFLFIAFLAVSVNPSLGGLFGSLFDILQMPYRLTAYISIALLFCVFALAGLSCSREPNPGKIEGPLMAILLASCVTISFCGLIGKLIHADAIRSVDPLVQVRKLAHQNEQAEDWYPGLLSSGTQFIGLPRTYYCYPGYSIADGFSSARPSGIEAEQPIAFMAEGSTHFGRIQPLRIEVTKPTLIVTNVLVFPWNVLMVDGSPRRGQQIYAITSGAFSPWMRPMVESVPLSAGKHVIEYRFIPDKAWRVLGAISWAFFFLWIALLLFVIVTTARKVKQNDRM